MLALFDRAFKPSSSIKDKMTYLTSIQYLQTIRADNTQLENVAETIQSLLASASTRYVGLVLLETALQQNPEITLKGNWIYIVVQILKSPDTALFKELGCRISRMIINFMVHDSSFNLEDVKGAVSKVVPVILEKAKDSEWIISAAKCLSSCMKDYPPAFVEFKGDILEFILHHMDTVSSSHIEALAECFAVLPHCSVKTNNKSLACEEWSQQFSKILNTMYNVQNYFLPFVADDGSKRSEISESGFYHFDISNDEFAAHMICARYFINLTKCLSKMLSTSSPGTVKIPLRSTLECVGKLFPMDSIGKMNTNTIKNQLALSVFSQCQVAALTLLEPLILKFSLISYSHFITHVMFMALQGSNLAIISKYSISPIRLVVWKLFGIWIDTMGSKISFDGLQNIDLIEELLKDISIQDPKSQPDGRCRPKTLSTVPESEFSSRKDDMRRCCLEALKALTRYIHTGAIFMDGKTLEGIFQHLLVVAAMIHPSRELPFPYDDEKCRKHLYKLLLAIAVAGNALQIQPIMSCIEVFNRGLLDSSPRVRSICHEGLATCRLFLHPKKPFPVLSYSSSDENKIDPVITRNRCFAGWQNDCVYVQNAPLVDNVPNVSEVAGSASQSFSSVNEDEMIVSDYIQVDTHYSEQVSEGQCNGDEDMIEIQNSSRSHELEESEEDEDEEEEDDRMFSEEEMNQEIIGHTESSYTPNATPEIQPLNSTSIAQETVEQNVTEQENEYEELRPVAKPASAKNVENSNENVHLNGEQKSVPEEQNPSSSAENVANENGIYASDEEEVGEEDEEEDNEEMSFPAEKKSPEFSVPSKKPKLIEDASDKCDSQEERGSRSPDLKEMMADFVISEVDQVES